eukprot:126-Chlamydomonas_euryale.AAC.1
MSPGKTRLAAQERTVTGCATRDHTWLANTRQYGPLTCLVERTYGPLTCLVERTYGALTGLVERKFSASPGAITSVARTLMSSACPLPAASACSAIARPGIALCTTHCLPGTCLATRTASPGVRGGIATETWLGQNDGDRCSPCRRYLLHGEHPSFTKPEVSHARFGMSQTAQEKAQVKGENFCATARIARACDALGNALARCVPCCGTSQHLLWHIPTPAVTHPKTCTRRAVHCSIPLQGPLAGLQGCFKGHSQA